MDILQMLAQKEGKCVIVVTHSKSVIKFADLVYKIKTDSFPYNKKGVIAMNIKTLPIALKVVAAVLIGMCTVILFSVNKYAAVSC
jgi:ABC-type phosphate/phosphonate transport system ATPase subunit